MTSGIISAKGRDLSELEQRGITYQDFIQTDAAINQGNSGGPLIDMKGKVIGINSIIFAPSGGSVGVGFAISSNLARQVIQDLRDKGRVIRGYIGVSIIEISDSEAKDNELPHGGAMIFVVEDHSPASRAGLKRWDLVLSVNGKKIISSRDLQNRISAFEPGETITLKIFRDKEMELKLKIAEKEGSIRLQRDSGGRASVDLGMQLENNSRAMEREYDLGTAKGVVITQVSRGGVAYEQGLRAGDVIVELNRREVGSVREFSQIISGKKPGSRVMMTINRYGRDLLVRFEVPE